MNRYLLVADVLGFSNIVSNLTHDSLSARIEDWTNIVKEAKRETNVERIQLLSDTLFAQEADSKEGLERLFRFSKLILERGMENYFPVRGAIAHGEVSWEDDLIYGEAVIKAHQLERSLDWIGIACEKLPKDKIPWSWDLVCHYNVPKKTTEVEPSAAIVWDMRDRVRFAERFSGGGLTNDEDKLKWTTFSKLINTTLFFKYVSEAKHKKSEPSVIDGEVYGRLYIW